MTALTKTRIDRARLLADVRAAVDSSDTRAEPHLRAVYRHALAHLDTVLRDIPTKTPPIALATAIFRPLALEMFADWTLPAELPADLAYRHWMDDPAAGHAALVAFGIDQNSPLTLEQRMERALIAHLTQRFMGLVKRAIETA
ncbi:hypothetical protein [Methylobacterium sp. 13MFTsu3.1M2]|uniref:hypothetical protein n=1 Tax=Methylobacterium sp. 13MFTsu3.1M2 TaxID=1502776 RepID=UPI0008DF446D|nr:hypothetical protein [Methylobacterium sp. 13MFTsu3.1M2]SFE09921.1 hypothetical protein SAMN02799627_02554 [Methylobacterium sp. 13MFTsu3.1M2]